MTEQELLRAELLRDIENLERQGHALVERMDARIEELITRPWWKRFLRWWWP